MFMLNGKQLTVGRAFTADGVQYPSNWLQLSSAAEKTAIGITEVADPVRADDRFYWNGESDNPKALDDVNEVWGEGETLPDGVSVGDPKYVQVWDADTESMVDSDEQLVTRGLKYSWKQQVKNTAGTLLAASDWYVTRNAELSTAIPDSIVTYRAAVRTECNRLETAIDAAADMDAFIAVVQAQNWPTE